jgi:excisionase family DNA binding protein
MTTTPLETSFERMVADALADALPAVVDRLIATSGPRAYTVHQVAERLEVSEQTVYRLIRAGDLAAVPHLSPVRVAATELTEFLAGRRAS